MQAIVTPFNNGEVAGRVLELSEIFVSLFTDNGYDRQVVGGFAYRYKDAAHSQVR